jgi:hypothetical protein
LNQPWKGYTFNNKLLVRQSAGLIETTNINFSSVWDSEWLGAKDS